jgi:hypothetical protein
MAGGQVTGASIVNGGFNFTLPPKVAFLGGGSGGNAAFLGGNVPGYPPPARPAVAHAVLTGGSVSSIVIDDGGGGYVIAPFMLLTNDDNDPYGCAAPAANDGIEQTGISVPVIFNGTCCPTDPLAVFSTAAGAFFTCKWMD